MQNINKMGFSLIEVMFTVAVIGVLTVTAAPKFLNSEREVKIAILNSVVGEIEAMNKLVHQKAILLGKQNAPANAFIDTNLGEINIWNGYLESIGEGQSKLGIFNAIDISDIDGFHIGVESGSRSCTSIRGGFGDLGLIATQTKGEECYIEYLEACSVTEKYKIRIESGGC